MQPRCRSVAPPADTGCCSRSWTWGSGGGVGKKFLSVEEEHTVIELLLEQPYYCCSFFDILSDP